MKTFIKGGLALAAFISLGLALAGCGGKQLPEALSSADDRARAAPVFRASTRTQRKIILEAKTVAEIPRGGIAQEWLLAWL